MLHAPITKERRVYTGTDESILKPFIPRYNQAASSQRPKGTPNHAEKYENYSVLQQHVLFWDRDGDDIIWPLDTFRGFRDLGFNLLFAILAVAIINIPFSIATRLGHTLIPDPFFRICVDMIHKAKHGSDTGIYDTEGRFTPARFEDLFTKYAKSDSKESLTLSELWQLTKGNRVTADPFGWFAAIFEWGTVFLLIQHEGKIEKEDLRKIYDGSLFFEIKEARCSSKGWHKGWGLGGDGMIGGKIVLWFSL